MPKNYYVILGIPASSTLSDIKSAYRRLAKEYHPDHYKRDEQPFLAIQEAYSVLSNPSRRKEYDSSLDLLRGKTRARTYGRSQPGFVKDEAEPLIPEEQYSESFVNHPASAPRSMAPGLDSLFSQFFSTVSERWDYQRNQNEQLAMEVNLTAEQAYRGGHIRVMLPAQIHCPDCGGRGSGGFHECWRCFGSGILQGEMPILLNYPAGIGDNHIVEFPLERHGVANRVLRVRFRIVP
ncbi:MAG: DnaJ domain-containing protein [Desulfocapsaceae bacterium]|nr:DnaJ domain-containing protein [Desulfocapsaceae bacterium]